MSEACTPEYTFESFVGQEKPKKILQILCRAARLKNKAPSHILISGPPGLGKSKLAKTFAAELGGGTDRCRFTEIIASNLQTPDQMVKQLLRLKENDVLFIDEIHGLSRNVEEILYGALEGNRISVVQSGYDDMMKGLGLGKKEPKATMVELPKFTCIAATTLSGLVSDPLRSRFVQCLTLEVYADDELARIILNAATKMNFALPETIAFEIARRSRATARIAIANLKWFAEYCDGVGTPPNETAIRDAFDLKEISPDGLTKVDMSYLSALVDAGELGLSTLAAATGESEETLAQVIEPFLIRKGFMRKGPRGRVATAKTIEMVNGKAA